MNTPIAATLPSPDSGRTIKFCLGLMRTSFLTMLFAVLVTAGATIYFVPKEYFSKVTVEVKLDRSGETIEFGPNSRSSSYDPQFVATQFAILQKIEILYPVIEQLELTKAYAPRGGTISREDAYLRLRKAMTLQEVRNTALIEVGVYDTDAQRAADIANTIGIVYKENRDKTVTEQFRREIKSSAAEAEQHRKKAEEAAESAMQFRAKYGIADSDPDQANSHIEILRYHAVGSFNEEQEIRSTVDETERLLESINNLRPDGLREVIKSLHVDDPAITQNLTLLENINAEEARLTNVGIGPAHPQIRALEAQKEAYSRILHDKLESVRVHLSDQLNVAKKRMSVFDDVYNAPAKLAERKSLIIEYTDKKNKAIHLRTMFESMESIYTNLKKYDTVIFPGAIVWEKAERSAQPARPNVALYALLAAPVGLVLGAGLFLIRYQKTRPSP